jgi:adenosylcobinamide kinase/adenosylcobinamide-phosphate guanylyltransferase
MNQSEITLAEITLVLGGCRSGKSRHALERAEAYPGNRYLFIATCVPKDAEMKARVARHQAERSAKWTALEVPVRLDKVILDENPRADVILVDCLTLWMSNLFEKTMEDDKIRSFVKKLTDALATARCPVILVSNEVGAGIVPDNALARRYRDAVGWMNQAVAAVADQVILTVAGIPMTIKTGHDGVDR